MIDFVLTHIHIYVSRPTIVFMDIFLLILAAIGMVGVVILRSRVEDLAIAIGLLQEKILKGQVNS
jgi:hypothetical protein